MSTGRCVLALLLLGTALCAGCTESQAPPVSPQAPPAPPATSQPLAFEAAITAAADVRAESSVQIYESTHTLTGVNLRFADLVSIGWRTPVEGRNAVPPMSALRVVADHPLPVGRFDVRIYVPGGDTRQLRTALRKALQSNFKIAVRAELRDMGALVLTAPGGRVKASGAQAGQPPTATTERQPQLSRFTFSGDDLALLAEQLEESIGRPVVDETHLRSGYRLHVEQTGTAQPDEPLKTELARRALKEQLALDLVAGRRSVEYLLVGRSAPDRP